MSHVDEGTLHTYIDGALPVTERAAFETHVAQCAACRARLAEERALAEGASQLLGVVRPQERPAPPLDQLRRVSRRSLWQVRTPFAWAASIALALSVGYYMRGTESAAPEPPTGVSLEQDRLTAPVAAAPSASKAPPETRAPARRQRAMMRDSAAVSPPPGAAADAVSGVIAIRPPEAQMNRAPVAAAAPSEVAPRLEEQPSKMEWPFVSQNQARQILGSAPVGIPALPVRSIRRNPAGDGSVVVEQELDESTVIQLFQRSVAQEKDAAPLTREFASAKAQRRSDSGVPATRDKTERLARFVGSLRVEIAGPLPPDSLNRLLEQVKPLP